MQQVKDPYDSITFGNSLSLRVDGAIGAMSLSPNGRDAVLAGRRGLFIIDLDDPFSTPRWLHHITSWEVADVQWSPHHFDKPSWCISTSNQKALLWDLLRPSDNSILNILHEHTRAITDINFHPSDPELLATCSIDTFILNWDMRTPRKAVQQWAEWRAGATQVKWNHENPHEIASSHDHSFYIWDTRKGAIPVLKIEDAHQGKINGIDFSHGLSKIITCSNDRTIKYWDLTTSSVKSVTEKFNYFDSETTENNEIAPSIIINTDFPVARARNLPFGSEKSCGIIPLRGGQDSIHILNCESALETYKLTDETQTMTFDPICSFKGHGGPIKDYLWRTRHGNYENFDTKRDWKDYQLVTWSSADYDLKLWPFEEDLYKKVNYNPLYQKVLKSVPTEVDESELLSNLNSTVNSNDTSSINTSNSTRSITGNDKKYNYNTYCIEPPVSLSNIMAKNHGDILSSKTMFQIAKKHKKLSSLPSQLNHLDWISGVRMGRSNDQPDKLNDSPSNLGEEVSMVAHTFPKVRFEKISVSTGELILSLRGPLPVSSNSLLNSSQPASLPSDNNITATTNSNDNDDNNDDEINNKSTTNTANSKKKSVSAPDDSRDDSKISNDPGEIADITSTEIPVAVTNVNSITASASNAGNTTIDKEEVNDDITVDEDNEQKLIFIRLEVNFPRNYPYLENRSITSSMTKKYLKANYITFNIEETYELTKEIKEEMIKNLKEISQFYSNRHQRFCLEPLLRYLMGDKIILEDSLLAVETPIDDEADLIQEVGNEGWADDLINQQPLNSPLTSPPSNLNNNGYEYDSIHGSETESDDSLDDQFSDFMPALNDEEMINSINSLGKSSIGASSSKDDDIINNNNFDSTPLPKGCGAMWSQTGQLVCFFIPKSTDEEDNKTLQKFSIFKFTDAGFSLNTHADSHVNHHAGIDYDSSDSEVHEHSHHENAANAEYANSSHEGEGENDEVDNDTDSTSDSFTNDWDDIEEEDLSSRFRVPGLFKTSVGLGTRANGWFNKNTISNGGTGSNYKSSIPGNGSFDVRKTSKKFSNNKNKNKNIVGIFDFKHLLPDKQELAEEYRVLGDSPENLARHNSEVALKYGLTEISSAWKLLEMVLLKDIQINDIHPVYYSNLLNPNSTLAKNVQAMNHLIKTSEQTKKLFNNKNYRFYWGAHPFGYSWLIEEMMNYFEKRGNLQMLVMLSCILYENTSNILLSKSNEDFLNIPIHTPYHIMPQPPSGIQIKRFHDVNHPNEIDRNYSYHGSFSTDRSDLKDIYDDQKHRSSSISMSRRDSLISTSIPMNSTRSIHSNSDIESPDRSNLKKNLQWASYVDSENKLRKQGSKINDFRKLKSHSSLSYQGPIGNNNGRSINNINGNTGGRGRIVGNKKVIKKGSVRPPPNITVEFDNVETLDLFDDIYTNPLLSSQNQSKLESYRETYANMLYGWGLPANRIKILKFNYPNFDNEFHKSKFIEHECNFGFREESGLLSSNTKYVNQPTSIESAKFNPWLLNTNKELKHCVLCNLLVSKRLVVCTNCEHVLHSKCATEWWGINDEDECASGCGCQCLDYRL